MKLLFDYDLLVNDIFYRSEHILSYIERHPNLSSLDKEAISNTILDALVYKGLIDPTKESLDLSNMCIVNDTSHYTYNPNPNITSIPLSIKEQMRNHSIVISGSIPISVFYAKPAGAVTYCIYDMNTALSTLFPTFSFINCSYDSPTRPGIRATKRPFLEVTINDELYLVDALTKRIFKSSWFKTKYNLTIDDIESSINFTKEQQSWYQEMTSKSDNYGSYLSISLPIMEMLSSEPKQEETIYEIERSKETFPHSFVICERINEEISTQPAVELLKKDSFLDLFKTKID
ncbi:MAG TPA: hypothetical protein DCE23_01755 [Firmicutes bacterium]|nr:hypothetical protein [Bacillota bacterium]